MARLTTAPKPLDEALRLQNLRDYQILDSEEEVNFDDITALASHICGTSISLISFVDQERQWFKSTLGLAKDLTETPRDDAFCAYNILDASSPLVVPDARTDYRFADNPLVTGYPEITFYAGTPLVTREGHALGSLCVIDQHSIELSEKQLDALARLGRQVVNLIELRRAAVAAELRHRKLNRAHIILKDFSNLIAHDLKAPLRNIKSYTEILREEYAASLPADGMELLQGLEAVADEGRSMIDGVLKYSSALNDFDENREPIDLEKLVTSVGNRLVLPPDVTLTFDGPVGRVLASSVPLDHILLNLISNAIKFRDKPCTAINVSSRKVEDGVRIGVLDNCRGFPPESAKSLFTMFYTSADGTEDSHGVGLNIVQRLVEMMRGKVEVSSEPGKGSEIAFVIPST